jgi:Holliday junction DNA helicase RuvA
MIARIEGKLVSLDTTTALVQVGPIGYEVMLPSYCISSLSGKIGTDIALCTMEYYEGSLGGGNLIPRMVGFTSAAERDFFAKFTTVKGMGIKKGLKALCIPIAQIATAIENGDEKMLLSLPGVGKRMAQQIVADLQGKLSSFALDTQTPTGTRQEFQAYQAEALEILIAWGEKRTEALELLELTCERHPETTSAEELVPLVYRMKQGIEV